MKMFSILYRERFNEEDNIPFPVYCYNIKAINSVEALKLLKKKDMVSNSMTLFGLITYENLYGLKDYYKSFVSDFIEINVELD